MERRQFPRKKVELEVEIISDDMIYKGIIINISERGIGVETEVEDPVSRSTRFNQGNKFQLRFKTPDGEIMTLNCKVMWSFKSGPEGLIKRVGMEVIFPPPGYISFCKSA